MLEESEPAMLVENQLFAVPSSYTDRWKTEHEKLNPVTILSEDGSSGDINFQIPPCTHGLLSLNDIYLEMEVAIKCRSGGTDWRMITAEDGVAPINNFVHSIFQNLNIELGGRTITDSSNYYAYRAYLETILSHTQNALNTQMTSSLFHLDEPGYLNDFDRNQGEQKRRAYFVRGQYVPLSGRIAADLFDQCKPLITGMPMTIRLLMNRPEFALRVFDADATKQFKIFIRNPRLAIRRYIPSPDYLLSVTNQLQTKTVKYHLERVVMRTTDLPRGTQSTVVTNLHMGQLPKVMFVGLVSSEDFHGARAKNPFNFQNYSVRQISVEVDGQSYPTKPYQADFDRYSSLECYDGLLDTLKQRNSPFGELPVSREGYPYGFTVFGFDLTPGGTGRGALTLVKQGNLSVSVTFEKQLPETVMMVCMMVYDSISEVNQHRQIIADFAT